MIIKPVIIAFLANLARCVTRIEKEFCYARVDRSRSSIATFLTFQVSRSTRVASQLLRIN